MGIIVRSGERREGSQLFRGVMKFEAERLSEGHIPFNVVAQHDETSGHGCAISERRPKSTLA